MNGDGPRGDVRPPEVEADEKTTLLTFLDYLRECIVAKLAGVSEQDARRPLVPSGTSLLWLVKHLTHVESAWFVYSYLGESDDAHDEPVTDADTVESVVAAYMSTVRRCNEIVAGVDDLDRPGVRSVRETGPPNMRWILMHMVEETARHAGHADIIREQLDGSTGR